MLKSKKSQWILSITVIILLVIVYYFGIMKIFSEPEIETLSFDTQKWQSVTLYTMENTRYLMLEDLFGKHELIGMNEKEILDLLGPQSDPSYFQEWDLRYWLGPEPSPFGVDSIWLLLKLEESRVTEYKLLTD